MGKSKLFCNLVFNKNQIPLDDFILMQQYNGFPGPSESWMGHF